MGSRRPSQLKQDFMAVTSVKRMKECSMLWVLRQSTSMNTMTEEAIRLDNHFEFE
jgi:hypothetical protein